MDVTTTQPGIIAGRHLRYLLTSYLFARGPLGIAELVHLLEAEGFSTRHRASKEVSDALRWEIGWGRVKRIGRGRYAPGSIPPSTARRIRDRVAAERAELSGRS